MKLSEIRKLFNLYSGESGDEYLYLLESAKRQVEEALAEGADIEDKRLTGLAAAIAYYDFSKISAARELQRLTASGNVPVGMDVTYRIRAAKELVDSSYEACSGLLKDRDFFFGGTKG